MPTARIINYSIGPKLPMAGLLINDKVYNLKEALLKTDHSINFDAHSCPEMLANWDNLYPSIDFIENRANNNLLDDIAIALDENILLHAPLLNHGGSLYCCEANYRDYVSAVSSGATKAQPSQPFVVTKNLRGTLASPNEAIKLPGVDNDIDCQGEIGLVIGRAGKNIPREQAMDHVVGLLPLIHINLRSHTKRYDVPFLYDWFNHKGFDNSTSMGPWITPHTTIDNINDLQIQLQINGSLCQDSSNSEMIFGFDALVAYISRHKTLFPGDVIATGTPGGGGLSTDHFLTPGNKISLTIAQLGTLENEVV